MIASVLDHLLTSWSALGHARKSSRASPMQFVDSPMGTIRVLDSGSTKPCIMFVPDGPNVIEHYDKLAALLTPNYRVVCFDMPGFGLSIPSPSYRHALDQGARAILSVLDALHVEKATLAFSCANGFYALRAAQIVPDRVSSLFLAQTPSLAAMHAWTKHVVPRPLTIPVAGQFAAWLFRRKTTDAWYAIALPKNADGESFRRPAHRALADGSCFCLAGVVQGLGRESVKSIRVTTTPCTMVWGALDRSHRHTDEKSLLECVPHATIVRFEDCGHFPDLEQPERYARLLIDHMNLHGPQLAGIDALHNAGF